MLSELRIAKTHAVDAQPRANARVTIACSCSLSSKPRISLRLQDVEEAGVRERAEHMQGDRAAFVGLDGVLTQHRHEGLRSPDHLGARQRGGGDTAALILRACPV